MGFLHAFHIPCRFLYFPAEHLIPEIFPDIRFQVPLVPFYRQHIIRRSLRSLSAFPLRRSLRPVLLFLLPQEPSEWLGFDPFLLLELMVFPSTQMIFFSFSPSSLFSISCHFCWSCCRFSGRIIPMTRCIAGWNAVLQFDILSEIILVPPCKISNSSQVSALANVASAGCDYCQQ